jgi:hypothetical protein
MRYVTRARWLYLLLIASMVLSLGVATAQAVQGPDEPVPGDGQGANPRTIPGLENLTSYATKLKVDGGMLVAGTDSSANGILARVLPNGQLDLTFGNDGSGLVTFDINAGQDPVVEVEMDGDGNILVVVSADGDLSNVTLARFSENGAPNPIPTLPMQEAAQTILEVDTNTDSNTLMACTSANADCSLRGAIRKANLDPVVVYGLQLDPQVYTLTFADGDGDTDLDIRTPTIEIYGAGARVDANGTSRAFDLSLANLYIENIELTDGNVADFPTLGNRRGGAIRGDSASTLNLVNASIIDNRAERGGGIFIDNQATLINVTFDGNTATTGAGLEIGGIANVDLVHVSLLDGLNINSGTLSMQNSVLADYPSGPGNNFCDGEIQTGGDNLFEDLDGCIVIGGTGNDITGQASGLGDLQTSDLLHFAPPSITSPLVNGAACLPSVTTDQLGNPRTGSTCDIGAIELVIKYTDWIYLPITISAP